MLQAVLLSLTIFFELLQLWREKVWGWTVHLDDVFICVLLLVSACCHVISNICSALFLHLLFFTSSYNGLFSVPLSVALVQCLCACRSHPVK